MNFIQEVLNLLERKQNKKTLDLKKDHFQFGRTKSSSVGNPLYSPKMNPHTIRYDDLKCNIISGLVEGTGTEFNLPMWSTVNANNCNTQTLVDSIFAQNSFGNEGAVYGNFVVTGDTVIEGNLLVNGVQTIVQSTIVEIADNIMRINSGGAGVDAGIEVIQPSGTYSFIWDTTDSIWSTNGESLKTENIAVEGSILIDSTSISNITTEAEGLNAEDNDNSLPTTAAVIDYFQTNDSYVENVEVVGTDMIFTGVNNGFNGTLDLSNLLDSSGIFNIVIDEEQNYTTDFEAIGIAPLLSAGFQNTSPSIKNYLITYTIQNLFSPGITTQQFVNYSVEIVISLGGVVNQIIEFPEEVFVQDGSVFQTSHSYGAINVPAGAKIYLRIKGNVDLIMRKTSFNVVESANQSVATGNMSTIVL